MPNDFPIFVLDVVTIFLFVALAAQTYYIFLLSKKITEQNKEIAELKEVVYAVYESSKGNPDVRIERHKMTTDGK